MIWLWLACASPCERHARAAAACVAEAGGDPAAWESASFCADADPAWDDWYRCQRLAWDRPCPDEPAMAAAATEAATCELEPDSG